MDVCWGCFTFPQHGTLLTSNKTGSILDVAQTIEVGRTPKPNKLSPLTVQSSFRLEQRGRDQQTVVCRSEKSLDCWSASSGHQLQEPEGYP